LKNIFARPHSRFSAHFKTDKKITIVANLVLHHFAKCFENDVKVNRPVKLSNVR